MLPAGYTSGNRLLDDDIEMAPKTLVLESIEAELHPDSSTDTQSDYMRMEMLPEPMGEHVYSMMTAGFVHDYVALSSNTSRRYLHIARVLTFFIITVGTNNLQAGLIWTVKKKFADPGVRAIQKTYNEYELNMYGPDHVVISNGFTRGVTGWFNASAFSNLPAATQEAVCSITFGNSMLLALILALWSMTVFREMKDIVICFYRLCILVPTVSGGDKILEHHREEGTSTVVGLPPCLKLVIFMLSILTRFVMACVLLHQGCAWLTATTNLQDLLLNGLALEFIFALKETIYVALASHRNKLMVLGTLYPSVETGMADLDTSFQYFGSSILFALTVPSFVLSWIFLFQRVLPDYRWDVHVACHSTKV